jgi:hypothetical protein
MRKIGLGGLCGLISATSCLVLSMIVCAFLVRSFLNPDIWIWKPSSGMGMIDVTSFDGVLWFTSDKYPGEGPMQFDCHNTFDTHGGYASAVRDFHARSGWWGRHGFACRRTIDPYMTSVELALPYWVILILCLLVPIFWFPTAGKRSWRRARGRCAKCGYDLRHSKERCPECGFALPKP